MQTKMFGMLRPYSTTKRQFVNGRMGHFAEKIPQVKTCGILYVSLLPGEADQTHDVNDDNSHGNNVAENGLHPVLDLPSLAGVCFLEEILPTPAVTLVAAEDDEDQGTQGQQVVGNDEIPQIQPCGALCEGLEGPQAVAQSGGQRSDGNKDTAEQTTLGTVPAEHLTDTGQNVLEDSQHGGHGSKDHEQEEDAAPQTATLHVVEDGSHGVKQQTGACAHFQIVGKTCGEDDEASGNGHEGIQNNDIDGFTHEGAVLVQIAAEDGHGADAQAQGEEGLVHSADDHIGGNLAQIGQQVEAEAFLGTGKGCAVDSQDDHQTQQSHHHILGDTLQAALQVEAQDCKADGNNDQHKGHIDTGVGDHTDKTQVGGLTDNKLVEVVQDPAGNYGVEAHQADVTEQGQIAVDMPLLTGLLQLLIHLNRACLGRAAHGELHDHNRQTQKDQAQYIDQNKDATAVLAGHPGELPDIATADGTACTQQDESQTGSQTFAIIHKSYSSLPI